MAQEIEIKFPLVDRADLVQRLSSAGAEKLYPETFEDNMVLDRRGELRTRGALLRIRRFGRYVIVTYKGPLVFDAGVKTREEVQTGVESFEQAVALFDAVGFKPVFRYQKLREVWRLGDAEVVIDRTPIGDYFEIEGTLARIEEIVRELQLNMSDAVRMTYADLYRQQRRTRADLPEHMVFRPEDLPSGG